MEEKKKGNLIILLMKIITTLVIGIPLYAMLYLYNDYLFMDIAESYMYWLFTIWVLTFSIVIFSIIAAHYSVNYIVRCIDKTMSKEDK